MMKRIGALSGMKLLVLLLVFLAGYTADVAVAHHESDEPDSLRLELNPLDYVPLAVGNRWTYEHDYLNALYHEWGDDKDLEKLKPLEIPGYPRGPGNPTPPDSLILVERILTIEITHTEVIDGFEYFVFSDADYTWPPLHNFFWGGKKVRLSDEGFLVFRWNGQDVPVYDLDHHHSYEPNSRKNRHTVTLPGESGTTKVDITRGMFFYSDGLRVESPGPESRYSVVKFEYSQVASYWTSFCFFLRGYGIGQLFTRMLGFEDVTIFRNVLTPLSANIDGEEIPYPKHTLSATSPLSGGYLRDLLDLLFSDDIGNSSEFSDTTTSVQPTSWGQLKQLFPGRSSPSQDPP